MPMNPLPILALALPVLAAAQGPCPTPVPMQVKDEGGPHANQCAELRFSHYPPTSGRHYSGWAAFKTYEFVLNAGNWLHSMEHGAVVFLINCRLPGDCKADFAKVRAFADALPADPSCDAATKRRVIITGDTAITTRFAAVAWNWSLQSDCLDTAAFGAFYRDHYAKAPEDFCIPGTDFPETGGCNAPLALGGPRGHAARDGAFWSGLLPRRARLSAEFLDLKGRRAGLADLGEAGPGPVLLAARDIPIPRGAVAARLRSASPAGPAVLAEIPLPLP